MVIFNDICRICSKYDYNNSSLLDELGVDLNEMGNMLFNCLDIKVSPFDQLPNQICSPCSFQLRMFNEFKSSALIIQKQLNSQLIQSSKLTSNSTINNQVHNDESIETSPQIVIKIEDVDNDEENDLEFIEEFLENTDNEFNDHDNDVDDDDDDDNNNDIDIKIEEMVNNDNDVIEQTINNCIDYIDENINEEETDELEVKIEKQKQLFKCKFCSVNDKIVYNSKPDLLKHISMVHTNNMCTECNKTFPTAWILSNHMQRHSNDRPMQCERCPKTFKTKNSLYVHQRVHDDYRKYICHLCGKAFRAHTHLKNHLDSHSLGRTYSCSHCSMKLKTKLTLKSHVRALHTNIFDFKCNICSKTFGLKSRYDRHLRLSHKLDGKTSANNDSIHATELRN